MWNRVTFVLNRVKFYQKNFFSTKCNVSENINIDNSLIKFCAKMLDISDYKVVSIMLKNPTFQKINTDHLTTIIKYFHEIKLPTKDVINFPLLLKMHPLTIKNRYEVLKECGFLNINIETLSKYITITRKKTILQLKQEGSLNSDISVEKSIISSLNTYPNLQNDLSDFQFDENDNLLNNRIKLIKEIIVQKLKVSYGISDKIINNYLNLKHKPINNMCALMEFLNNTKFDRTKILSYSGLLTVDIDNINKIFTEVKEIAGQDINTIIKRYPLIMVRDYKHILEMKKILKEENVSDEALRRHLEIFALSTVTVQYRLREIKHHPILKSFFNNPRMLGMVCYYKRVLTNLNTYEQSNKKCHSLHKLLTIDNELKRYIKLFGDRTRGFDVIKALSKFTTIENVYLLRRHPYWQFIPLNNILETKKYLEKKFSTEVILDNVILLLYPQNNILKEIHLLNKIKNNEPYDPTRYENLKFKMPLYDIMKNHLNLQNVSDHQFLNLILYLLEKHYNFTGDGVWIKP